MQELYPTEEVLKVNEVEYEQIVASLTCVWYRIITIVEIKNEHENDRIVRFNGKHAIDTQLALRRALQSKLNRKQLKKAIRIMLKEKTDGFPNIPNEKELIKTQLLHG